MANRIRRMDGFNDVYIGCPGCGSELIFHIMPIIVNCESKKEYNVGDLLQLKYGCANPFCGWSKVGGVMNATNKS